MVQGGDEGTGNLEDSFLWGGDLTCVRVDAKYESWT